MKTFTRITLTDLSAVYSAADSATWPNDFCRPGDFWRVYLALSYWMALRPGDALALRWRDCGATIALHHGESGPPTVYPSHPIIERHLEIAATWERDTEVLPVDLPPQGFTRGLHRLCEAADVEPFGARELRRTSAFEWERACHGAASIALGHVPNHPLRDPLVVLREAAESFEWPEAMKGGVA